MCIHKYVYTESLKSQGADSRVAAENLIGGRPGELFTHRARAARREQKPEKNVLTRFF